MWIFYKVPVIFNELNKKEVINLTASFCVLRDYCAISESISMILFFPVVLLLKFVENIWPLRVET